MQFMQIMNAFCVAFLFVVIAIVLPSEAQNNLLDSDNLDGWYSQDSQGDGGEFLETEKRFLPWFMFKNGGRPIKIEELRKARTIEKRGKLELVTFPCLRKSDAVCHNGGRGPRIMRKGKGTPIMCACMCPFGYSEAKCDKSWWLEQ